MGAEGRPGRTVLRKVIMGQRRDVLLGSVLGALHQGGEALVPVLIGLVIDRAVSPGDTGELLRWTAVLAAVYIGLSFSFRFGARAGERASEVAAHRLRTDLVARVLDPAGGADDGRLPGALTTLATEDARRAGAVIMAFITGAAALTGLLAAAVVLLRTSLPLGTVVLLGTPLLLGLGRLLSTPLERRSETEQEYAAHASGVAADLVAGLRVLKGIGAEPAAVARYRGASRDSLRATLRAARAEAWQNGIVLALTGAFIAVVALIGGRLATRGDISLGELVSAVGLALFLLGPLSEFSWVNAEFAQGRASAARIAAVLATASAVSPGTDRMRLPVEGGVRLRDVTYRTLREVELRAGPGEMVGVVTTDPADATALLHCLGRGADPLSGSVELDGQALSALGPADIRGAILVAGHDADLFEGSLAANVSAAAPAGADPGPAMAASGADEVAGTLPHGAATLVTERGRSLSGGQRQRVALARALAAEPPVLVLHDPATAVDAVTEARIADGIREIRRGLTTILLTSSPALLAVTDRVVFLKDGRVAGAATHAELLTRHPDYRTAVLS